MCIKEEDRKLVAVITKNGNLVQETSIPMIRERNYCIITSTSCLDVIPETTGLLAQLDRAIPS